MLLQKSKFWRSLIFGGMLVSLVGSGNVNSVAETKQSLSVDLADFIKAGCVKEGDKLNCSNVKLEEKFGCDEIISPANTLGGLSPKVSVAECRFVQRASIQGISRKGCRLPLYNKYVVYTNRQFKALNTAEEFGQFFGPVETKEEALSFAVALTNSYAAYKVIPPKGYRVYVDKIADTEVKKVKNGYQVRLFSYQACGCGPHPYFAVDYEVTNKGEVKEISRQKLYEDPKQDGLCVD